MIAIGVFLIAHAFGASYWPSVVIGVLAAFFVSSCAMSVRTSK